MPQIDIDFDVFKELTRLRPTEDVTYNDVVRGLLKLPAPAKTSKSGANGSKPWVVSDTSFPAGSEFMADYKGKVYSGVVKDGKLELSDGHRFSTPSAEMQGSGRFAMRPPGASARIGALNGFDDALAGSLRRRRGTRRGGRTVCRRHPQCRNQPLPRLALEIRAGHIADADGLKTETFNSVVHVDTGAATDTEAAISADNAAAVIDVTECMDLDAFRAAYVRVADAEKLKQGARAPYCRAEHDHHAGNYLCPSCGSGPEELGAELERLNTQTPDGFWPDMIVAGSTGTIDYAVQFPGAAEMGSYLPPAEGVLEKLTPPMYIVMVMARAGSYTFNKMTAFLIAHLAIFSPGATLPELVLMKEGIIDRGIVLIGYQYNLKGVLRPVPRQSHSDRYFPPAPVRLESPKGELLATLQYIPWQDGGTVLLKGKLPLEGLLVFIGDGAGGTLGGAQPQDRLRRGGADRRPLHPHRGEHRQAAPPPGREFPERCRAHDQAGHAGSRDRAAGQYRIHVQAAGRFREGHRRSPGVRCASGGIFKADARLVGAPRREPQRHRA